MRTVIKKKEKKDSHEKIGSHGVKMKGDDSKMSKPIKPRRKLH